jgi:hypothetical protein
MAVDNTLQPLICPYCGGVLALEKPGQVYQCALGHVYSPSKLDVELRLKLQQTIQQAIRQMQEGELLQAKISESGLVVPNKFPSVLPLAQQILAALSAPPDTDYTS